MSARNGDSAFRTYFSKLLETYGQRHFRIHESISLFNEANYFIQRIELLIKDDIFNYSIIPTKFFFPTQQNHISLCFIIDKSKINSSISMNDIFGSSDPARCRLILRWFQENAGSELGYSLYESVYINPTDDVLLFFKYSDNINKITCEWFQDLFGQLYSVIDVVNNPNYTKAIKLTSDFLFTET